MLTRLTLLRTVIVGATLTAVCLPAARAQTLNAETRAQLQRACAGDAQKLCPGVQPGGGRLATCLKGQPDRISETCKGALMSFYQGR